MAIDQETKRRVGNAQKFKEFLKPYPPEIQARFIYAKNPDNFREIDPTLKERAEEYFSLRQDYFTHANTTIPQEEPEAKKEKEHKKEEFDRVAESGHADEESPPPPYSPEPKPMTQRTPIAKGMGFPSVPALRRISNKRALRQSIRKPGQGGNSRGSPIRKNKAKQQLRRKLLGAAKKRAAAALLGSLGLPAIITAVIVVVCAIVFFIIIAAVGCYIVNNPIGDLLGVNYCKFEEVADEPPPIPTPTVEPGPGPDPAPECGSNNSNIDRLLREDFGIIMRSGTENADCETRRTFYRVISIPARSPMFMSLLKPRTTFVIECSINNNIPGSHGFVPYPGTKMFYENCYKIRENFKQYAFLVLHETGHVMKWENYRQLQQNFPRTRLFREDRNCFADEGVIKTYNRRGLNDYEKTSESSAEAIALYVYNRKDGEYADIINFKSECPSIYQWAKSNIYGEGVEFN